jgi:pilus assembly protein CpaB
MFGILGLLVVGYVAKNLLAVQEKRVAPAMRDVPMAITDISPGTILTEKHLGMGKMQVDQLTREMLLTNRVIIGRAAKTPLKAAEPIKANQLYQPGELPPLELSAGMRAVSIQVNDGASMVDGMIKPGDHVDVLFTAMSGGAGTSDASFQGGLTMRLFEGVKILAINRSFTQATVERGNNFVTLELTEPQANVVVLARDKGKLTLTYNPNGKGNGGIALTNSERTTFYEILGLTRADKPKDPMVTEIYRGPTRSTLVWDASGRFVGTRPAPQQTNTDQYVLPNAGGQVPDTKPGTGPGPAATPTPSASQPAAPQNNPEQPRAVPTASRPLEQLN